MFLLVQFVVKYSFLRNVCLSKHFAESQGGSVRGRDKLCSDVLWTGMIKRFLCGGYSNNVNARTSLLCDGWLQFMTCLA